MRTVYDIIKKPIITEGSMAQIADRKYTFEVELTANKIEIKKAIEEIFPGTEVEKVTTSRVLGKIKRMGNNQGSRPDWKKAVVKLTENSKTIEFFDGLI
ncbi:MAG: 50S ribosomal protein L23 [Bacillota bacterium]|nr:50S ribosomal protein L23 [Bacillota bacterium]